MEEVWIKETIRFLTKDIVKGFVFPEDSSFYEAAVSEFIFLLVEQVPCLKEALELEKMQWEGGSENLIVNCIFIIAKGTKGFSIPTAERKLQVMQSIALVKHVLEKTKYVTKSFSSDTLHI